MNILAIGAHFDDVELGCGGTIARMAQEGHRIFIYVATNSGFTNYMQQVIREPERALAEGHKAAEILGAERLVCGSYDTNNLEANDDVVRDIIELVEKHDIEQVFTHWTGDVHLDHRNLGLASLKATRHVPRILLYRSNYYLSPDTFNGNFFVDITSTIEIKKQAVMAHETEFERIGEKWITFFTNANENEGLLIGVGYAEAFQIVKYII